MSKVCHSVIRVENLEKSYGGFRALRGIGFEVQRGEVFGFLGPNGAGKTTAIRCMLDLIRPSSGLLRIAGLDPQRDPVAVRARCGYLPGELRLDENITAHAALRFFRHLRGGDSACRRRADALSERLELNTASKIKNLSKGNKQKIGIVAAFMHEPELLLLDEPTSGLDPIGTREMKDLILRLRDQGKTVLMCSHLLADVQDVCDRIAILYQGELKELGRVDNLLSVQDVTQIQAKGLSDEAKQEIQEVIQRHSGEMISMENPTSTLEELFLSIVRESEERPGHRHIEQE